MNLDFQKNAIDELHRLAEYDRHSILIEGVIGCGKSYLAKMYAQFLNINDIVFVRPNVQDIRDAIDATYNMSSKIVFCIENLDSGVISASYTLLKFLEEPSQNVYIIVTCRNRFLIPDTIISRSVCVTVPIPTESDVNKYAQELDPEKYNLLKSTQAWYGVRSIGDVEYIYKMKSEHIDYYRDLKSMFNMKDSILGLSWKLSHYPDKTETDIKFVLNCLYRVIKNQRVRKYIIQCLNDLSTSRIATHAVISKFLFDVKYGN